MTRVFNKNQYMIFYKDKDLFKTKLFSMENINQSLAWQETGGTSRDNFLVCQYDYSKELFFNDELGIEIDMNDISRGCLMDWVLTQFKAEFFPKKLTKVLNKAC